MFEHTNDITSLVEDIKEGWSCKTASDADWAMRTLAEIDAYKMHITREIDDAIVKFQKAIKMLEYRKAETTLPLNNSIDFFNQHLIKFYTDNPPSGKTKTLKLAFGDISARAGRESIDVSDKEAFLEWCDKNNQELYKREPSKTLISDYIKAGNEKPDGVEVVVGDTTITVKPVTNIPIWSIDNE